MTNGKLAGKVALITGAGSGIGAATARLMAAEGASVAVTGIPEDGVIAIAAEITDSGGSAVAIPTDVSDPEQVETAVTQTVEAFGRLDILVPNAGIQMHNEDRNLHELPEEVWDRTHDVNYKGQYFACKYGLAQMVKQGEGSVVIIVASDDRSHQNHAKRFVLNRQGGAGQSGSPYSCSLRRSGHSHQQHLPRCA